MNKIIGYILAVVGVGGIALSFEAIQKAFAITLPTALSTTTLTIIGLVLLVIGIFLVIRSGSRENQPTEVPIYQGKTIVGYRRVGK